MAHCVWSPDGLSGGEIRAILSMVYHWGRLWRTAAKAARISVLKSEEHIALVNFQIRTGAEGIDKIVLSGVAAQLENHHIATERGPNET